jgi:hypothetical protein
LWQAMAMSCRRAMCYFVLSRYEHRQELLISPAET